MTAPPVDGVPPNLTGLGTCGGETLSLPLVRICLLGSARWTGWTARVGHESVGQLRRAAQRDEVAAGHLVDGDPEPFGDDAALQLDGEEAVVAAREETGGHVGPRERPRLRERGSGLLELALRERVGADVGGHVVEERLDVGRVVVEAAPVAVGLRLAGFGESDVAPPLAARLARA